jgi:uncharacterized protein (DUF983 family)
MTANDEYPPIPAVSAGLRGRCPRCGYGRLFAGFLKLAPSCSNCGLNFAFVDTGDGPAFFVSFLAGIIGVAVALFVDVTYEPPIWVDVAVALPVTVIFCLATLRPIKGLLIALQYKNRAEQGRLE